MALLKEPSLYLIRTFIRCHYLPNKFTTFLYGDLYTTIGRCHKLKRVQPYTDHVVGDKTLKTCINPCPVMENTSLL